MFPNYEWRGEKQNTFQDLVVTIYCIYSKMETQSQSEITTEVLAPAEPLHIEIKDLTFGYPGREVSLCFSFLQQIRSCIFIFYVDHPFLARASKLEHEPDKWS